MADKKDPSQSPRYTNGPVVKTGPTAGQNRSRNDDGTWHKKRSDAGKPREKKEKKSGCFITTAACVLKGLPDDCYELTTLRLFRDEHLLTTTFGRVLVEHYYNTAPDIATRLTNTPELNRVWTTIEKVVAAIEQKDFVLATELYQAMVCRLEREVMGVNRESAAVVSSGVDAVQQRRQGMHGKCNGVD